jgi:hypothetical protein
LKILIVHDDFDAVRAVLVPFAARADVQACDQSESEDGQQDPAVGHGAASSPENNKTRREAGLAAVA